MKGQLPTTPASWKKPTCPQCGHRLKYHDEVCDYWIRVKGRLPEPGPGKNLKRNSYRMCLCTYFVDRRRALDDDITDVYGNSSSKQGQKRSQTTHALPI